MKTKFLSLLFVQILVLGCCLSFTSCSDDDDETPSTSIVGTWESSTVKGYTVKFNKNSTGMETLTFEGNTMTGDFEYIYNAENQEVTILGSNENVMLENGKYKAVVGNTKMELGGMVFNRK